MIVSRQDTETLSIKSLENNNEIKSTIINKICTFKEEVKNHVINLFKFYLFSENSEFQTAEITPFSIPKRTNISANQTSKLLNTSEKIRLGTYNILFPQIKIPPDKFCTKIGYSSDSNGKLYNNIDSRLEVIKKNIKNANLDVTCLQEVTEKTFKLLSKAFANKYNLIWERHPVTFHGVAVLYNKKRFTKLFSQSIPISIPVAQKNSSSTFNKPRNKSRVHLVVDLQDVTTKKVFRVVSCHLLDPRDFTNKGIHVKEVITSLKKIEQDYVVDRTIIAGDMNQDQIENKGIKPLRITSNKTLYKRSNKNINKSELSHIAAFAPFLKNQFYVDGNMEPSSFFKTDYTTPTILKSRRRIDWIWSQHFKPTPELLPNFDNSGSDHALVASTIC